MNPGAGSPGAAGAAERRRSAALAGHQGDVGRALDALADEEPAVRATALGALRRMGRLDSTLLQAALTDASPSVRRRAAELAAGDRAVSLLAALDDDDPTVVEVVAFACGEQGRLDDPDGAAVVARLCALAAGHDDALVREAAVAALGAIGDPAGLPAILAATGTRRPSGAAPSSPWRPSTGPRSTRHCPGRPPIVTGRSARPPRTSSPP